MAASRLTLHDAPRTAALRAIDAVCLPLTAVSALWLKFVRRAGVAGMPASRDMLMRIGVFPIRDHYYEPLFKRTAARTTERALPGIDLSVPAQLEMLDSFRFSAELTRFPLDRAGDDPTAFHYHNGAYGPGDAEYLYSIIRARKPSRLIEVGSGHSTLMAREAIRANKAEDPGYACEMICIEPYEQPWLEQLGVRVIRQCVETVDRQWFASLERNDILFIDSSHVIRPQGDVLYLFQEVLPLLNSGVLVHVHDIFTPGDYPEAWVSGDVRFWNEQYLLESFLAFNSGFRVIGALNYLCHHHRERFGKHCPVFAHEASSEPERSGFKRVSLSNRKGSHASHLASIA